MSIIKKWKVKAYAQKVISMLPFKERINYWFQKNITKGVALTDDHFEDKLIHAKNHLKRFSYASNKPLKDSSLLELGTGWHPVVPIFFYLAGVGSVFTLDVRDWMRKETLMETLKRFSEWQNDGRLKTYLQEMNESRWHHLFAIQEIDKKSVDEVCDHLELNRIIGDARDLHFEDHSMDFICSNNTLEHIPTHILEEIIDEFKRVLVPGGVMSHHIDMEDRYSHFDTSIGPFNFLQYSDKQWKRIDNSLLPLNRLRFVDYQKMVNNAGFDIISCTTTSGEVEDLKSLILSEKFNSYTTSELLVLHGYFTCKAPK